VIGVEAVRVIPRAAVLFVKVLRLSPTAEVSAVRTANLSIYLLDLSNYL
jgi:hypothetical protein